MFWFRGCSTFIGIADLNQQWTAHSAAEPQWEDDDRHRLVESDANKLKIPNVCRPLQPPQHPTRSSSRRQRGVIAEMVEGARLACEGHAAIEARRTGGVDSTKFVGSAMMHIYKIYRSDSNRAGSAVPHTCASRRAAASTPIPRSLIRNECAFLPIGTVSKGRFG